MEGKKKQYIKKENNEINLFKEKKSEDEFDLYIPIYPFNDEPKTIKLNLIINYGMKHYKFGNYFHQNKINCLNYFPCPKSIHISELKFRRVKKVNPEINNFICQSHDNFYDSFCSCFKVYCPYCSMCKTCKFKKYYSFDELNWKQFDNNKKKIINIINL